MKQTKITLITHGRFASVNLAEYLQKIGRLAAIYTAYPRYKLRDLAIDRDLLRSVPALHTMQLALMRLPHCPQSLIDEVGWWHAKRLRAYAARTLPECGVVSAMSGSGLNAGMAVQERGGVYVCERGSTHIRWQERLLVEEYGRLGVPLPRFDSRMVANEEAEYAVADAIAVGSRFAMRSFVEMGFPAAKLRVTPYGVNLSSFRPCAERAGNFRVLYAGSFSIRKGLQYLLQAFRLADLPGSELIAIGGSTPDSASLLERFPTKNFTWKGIVPRDEVPREMSRASVFVLASIEEGLAAVIAQAMACGCPVIATENTGAEELFEDGKEGFIVRARDADAIADRLTRLHQDPQLRAAMSAAALSRVRELGGWDQYGQTMVGVFDELLAKKTGGSSKQDATTI